MKDNNYKYGLPGKCIHSLKYEVCFVNVLNAILVCNSDCVLKNDRLSATKMYFNNETLTGVAGKYSSNKE